MPHYVGDTVVARLTVTGQGKPITPTHASATLSRGEEWSSPLPPCRIEENQVAVTIPAELTLTPGNYSVWFRVTLPDESEASHMVELPVHPRQSASTKLTSLKEAAQPVQEWKEWPLESHELKTERQKQQALDEWRLICALAVRLKRGEIVRADGKNPTTMEQVVQSGVAVLKSLLAADAIELHPKKWAPSAKEFILDILSELKKQGVDAPLKEAVEEYLSKVKARLVPFVVIDSLACIVGSSVYNLDKSPPDLDILLRTDRFIYGPLANALSKSFEGKSIHWVYSPTGPHADYISLYDLVAVPLGWERPFSEPKVQEGLSVVPSNLQSVLLAKSFIYVDEGSIEEEKGLIFTLGAEAPKISIHLKLRKLFPDLHIKTEAYKDVEAEGYPIYSLMAVPRPIIKITDVYEEWYKPYYPMKRIAVAQESQKAEEAVAEHPTIQFLGTGGLTTAEQGKRRNSTIAISYHTETVLLGVFKDFPVDALPSRVSVIAPTTSKAEPQAKEFATYLLKNKRSERADLPIVCGEKWLGEDISIEPFKVFHTTTEQVYGYRVTAGGKVIVVAPEFLRINWQKLKGADIAILDGASVGKDIIFTGEAGGHQDILTSFPKVLEMGIKALFYIHIGLRTENFLKRLKGNELQSKEFSLAEAVNVGFVTFPNDGDTFRTSVLKEAVRPGQRLSPQKPHMGFWVDFWSADELWEKWAKEKIEKGHTIAVSVKWDGMRVLLGKDGHTSIWFADTGEDRADSKFLRPLASKLAKLPSFVLDGEFLVKKGDKVLPRTQIFSALAGNIEAEPYIAVFDLLYWDEEDYSKKPYKERLAKLHSIASQLPQEIFEVEHRQATDRASLETTTKWVASQPGSEGAMASLLDVPWESGGSDNLAKIHTVFTMKTIVLDVAKMENGYTYHIGLANPPDDYPDVVEFKGNKWADLKKTFVSKERLAGEGETLEVRIEELILLSTGALATGKPTPLGPDKTRGPYSIDKVIEMARRAHVLKEEAKEETLVEVEDTKPQEEVDGSSKERQEQGRKTQAETATEDRGTEEQGTQEEIRTAYRDSEEAEDISEATYHRDRCVDCAEPPTIEILWAEGMAHAWFCNKHFEEWLRKDKENSRKTGYGSELSSKRVLKWGVASKHWRDGPPTKEQAEQYRGEVQEVDIGGENEPSPGTRSAAAHDYWEKNWKDVWQDAVSGRYILHCHIRGIPKDEVKLDLKELLEKGRSVHFDLRMERSKQELFGFTLYGGKAEDNLPKLKVEELDGEKIQAGPKLSMPYSWISVGRDKPYVSEPGGVGATSRLWCLDPNIPIWCNGRIILSKDIKLQQNVGWSYVTDIAEVGNLEGKYLMLEGLPGIKVTNEHRLLVGKNPFYHHPRRYINRFKWNWLQAEDIRVGDYLFVPIPPRPNHKRPKAIPISENVLYLMGLYVAEGCSLQKNYKKRSHTLNGYPNLTLEDGRYADGGIQLAFGKEAKAEANTVAVLAQKIFHKGIVRWTGTGWSVNIYDTKLARLFSYWFGASAYNKRIPVWVYNLTQDLRDSFIKGYLDGDGYRNAAAYKPNWVNRGGEFVGRGCATASKQLAWQLWYLLLMDGYFPYFRSYLTPLGTVMYQLTIGNRDTRSREGVFSYAPPRKANGQFGKGPSGWLVPVRKVKPCNIEGAIHIETSSEIYQIPVLSHNSKFFAVDWGTFKTGSANRSFFELFLDGKILKGRYYLSRADIGGRRLWIFRRSEDIEPYAESHNLEMVKKEMKARGHEYFIWRLPGEKGEVVKI